MDDDIFFSSFFSFLGDRRHAAGIGKHGPGHVHVCWWNKIGTKDDWHG
jgi:hypothetical protein